MYNFYCISVYIHDTLRKQFQFQNSSHPKMREMIPCQWCNRSRWSRDLQIKAEALPLEGVVYLSWSQIFFTMLISTNHFAAFLLHQVFNSAWRPDKNWFSLPLTTYSVMPNNQLVFIHLWYLYSYPFLLSSSCQLLVVWLCLNLSRYTCRMAWHTKLNWHWKITNTTHMEINNRLQCHVNLKILHKILKHWNWKDFVYRGLDHHGSLLPQWCDNL